MANSSPKPGLVVSRTPVRVSFAGGGTDLPDFYQHHNGAVLSTAIDKYIYVTVKRHGVFFNEQYRLNYSESEHVNRLEDIKNDIARECLRFLPVDPPIYISTVADLPAFSGLGSSSSFAVGLLNALYALKGERVSAAKLAEDAAYVEMEVLGHPIGKQDHYAAAFGGLNYFSFDHDGQVAIEPQHFPNGGLQSFFSHIQMFWTGIWRNSSSVLTEQKRNTPSKIQNLLEMRDHARHLRTLIKDGSPPVAFGKILDTNWQQKRQLASGITNDRIDAWYQRGMDAGAFGGKLCGAGGGGFLLFIVSPERQDAVRRALSDIHPTQIGYEAQGSQLLLAA
jgi:D-glycero-alpha-D-manno-heptose-7-phosphate kinase